MSHPSPHLPNALTHHTQATNRHGTVIRVEQQWCDANPGRDPIRHFTILDIEEQYGAHRAICRITHGIDRTTGERVPIEREVRIDIDRLHPVRTGYQQVTNEGDAS